MSASLDNFLAPSSRRAPRPAEAIEWEELPSLADLLRQRLVMLGERQQAPSRAAAWTATLAAELDPPLRSKPFREALLGLDVREVDEPDVFRHFFGSSR
jgi:hypothetical protein